MRGEPKSSFGQVLQLLFRGVISSLPASKKEQSAESVPARICFLLKFGVKTILSQRSSPAAASRQELSQPQGKAAGSPSTIGAEKPMLKGTWPYLGRV